LVLRRGNNQFPIGNFCATAGLSLHAKGVNAMLVERGLRVMNVDVIGKAYDIASYYLRATGAVPDTAATNEALLELIVQMVQRGETNQIRLANKAIAHFEAAALI
jgi:hypothetical protein